MIKGLYVAGTNMVTNTHKLDVISNNLANVNTTGFKKDEVVVESFNNRLFYRMNGSNLPFQAGNSKVEVSDIGTEKKVSTDRGFFRVQTDNGIHYDKSLRFIKDKDGYLRTAYKNIGGTIDPLKGHLLLGLKGPIYVGEGTFDVDETGAVSVDGTQVDNLVSTIHPSAIGTMSAGIKRQNVLVNYEQGQLERTDSTYDIAIKGEGFFKIDTASGPLYTRNGTFTTSPTGELVTLDGDTVLGLSGPIVIEDSDFAVNAFGEVIQNGEITDKLQIENFTNPGDLYKVGGNFFALKADMTGEAAPFEGEVLQGFSERSNSDAITEMINLIQMNRNYEASQKVITTIDELIGKAVNEVGRV
ncbi:flagellar basal body rod C-terminal domain-containing protein [Fusibacter sp. JL298sf-3]